MALCAKTQAYHKQISTACGIYQQQHHRPIAPAPYAHSQKVAAAAHPYSMPSVYAKDTTLESNSPSVVRRNARERNRVKQVNNGFSHLRQHIPTAIIADLSNGRRGIGPGANKKLSKVDTLRMAVEYIRRLKHVIDVVDSSSDAASVSSYNSCDSSYGTPSPPPQQTSVVTAQNRHDSSMDCYQTQQQYYGFSYGGSFPHQQQQHNSTMISPTGSLSSAYSSASDYQTMPANSASAFKMEPTAAYDEYSNNSAEDEELLDYISLWQDEM